LSENSVERVFVYCIHERMFVLRINSSAKINFRNSWSGKYILYMVGWIYFRYYILIFLLTLP